MIKTDCKPYKISADIRLHVCIEKGSQNATYFRAESKYTDVCQINLRRKKINK